MSIPDETKARWLPALRDPAIRQCSCELHDVEGGYCCLGVYAKSVLDSDSSIADVNDGELLVQTWADRHGITKSHQQLLSHLNDGTAVQFANDDPLFSIAVTHAEKFEYCEVITEESLGVIPGHRFTFRKHSFDEIADIIEKEL